VTVLDKVLDWSVGLHEMWMRDALRRLVVQQSLAPSDLDEVFELFEYECGLRDGTPVLTSVPLEARHLPNRTSAGPVSLAKIGPVSGVNAIVEDGTIELDPSGMNVIYGRNASGKSGYSRVLKKACRARDQKEEVLGNVFVGDSETQQRAQFSLLVGDQPHTVVWTPEDSPEETASIAVFDARCARVYLGKAGEVACRPYGFDVFKGLCEAMDGFTARLNDEKKRISAALVDLPVVAEGTSARACLDALSAKTTDDQIGTACAFEDTAKSRLDELQKMLAKDPKEEAKRLQRLAGRLKTLAVALDGIDGLLNGAKPKLALAEATMVAAQDAVQKASELQFEDCLPGVGSEAWRILFAAAEKYSVSAAYRGEDFPFVGTDARCVLCHQPLSEDAKRRFANFKEFVADEAGNVLAAADKDLKEHEQLLLSCVRSIVVTEDALLDEIGELDGGLKVRVTLLRDACSLSGKTASGLDESARNDIAARARDVPDLKLVAQKLETEASEVLKGLDADERAKREAEVADLEARRILTASQATITKRRDQVARLDLLDRAKRQLRTKAVTDVGMDILDTVVTADLIEAWKTACTALDVANRRVKMSTEGGKGDCKTSLELEGCTSSPGLDDILSEGEQRALALAAFIAELSLADNNNAIVFDDPVCSLDHNHRARVAKSFAELAGDRQVVVFTHDLVFVKDLEQYCANKNVKFTLMGVRRGGANEMGVPDEDPIELRPLGQHVHGLGVRLSALKKEHVENGESVEYRKNAQSWFVQLRDAWEKAVEEGLLNKVVQSFVDDVMTDRLAEVTVEDRDWREVNAGMTEASEMLHRMSDARNAPFPSPQDMQEALDAIDSFQKRVKARRKELAKLRGKVSA
jgi:energy-coupling factor transporter ATP-binding protein EcfA2